MYTIKPIGGKAAVTAEHKLLLRSKVLADFLRESKTTFAVAFRSVAF